MQIDLPLELWLHIISFLPKGYDLCRLMGINRMLFQLGLDQRYAEVRFIFNSQNMMMTFDQLKFPDLARRVSHVYVRPAFLPGMGESPSLFRTAIHKLLSRFSTSTELDSKSVLASARAGFRHCRNVRELTIVLHDFSIPRSFMKFLDSTWMNFSGSLRKLVIDITLAKLPLVLGRSSSCRLFALEELEVYIAYSRFASPSEAAFIPDVLLPFTTSHKQSLRSLSISSSIPLDWSLYLNRLGYFPFLQKLLLAVTISSATLSDPASLTRVLYTHRQTLKYFGVRKHHGFHGESYRDSSYSVWVTDQFSALDLPALQKLYIGLWPSLPYPSSLSLSIIPRVPCLVSLSIFDIMLNDTQVNTIVDSLGVGSGRAQCLQELRLSVERLHPSLVDLLATTLPRLKSLDLTYTSLTDTPDAHHMFLAIGFMFFREAMRTRLYPTWELEQLRLSCSSSCGHGHVHLGSMRAVARCIPRGVSFDLENDCVCDRDDPLLISAP